MLTLVLSMLFFTKHQYAVGLWLAVTLTIMTRVDLKTRLATNAYICVGSLVAGALSLIITPIGHLGGFTAILVQPRITHPTALLLINHAIQQFCAGVIDVYLSGTAFTSFWFTFGLRGARYLPPPITSIVTTVVLISMMSASTLVVLSQRIILFKVARILQAKYRHGIKLLFADTAGLSYLIVTLILLTIYVTTDGRLALQGRYWLPIFIPLIVFVSSRLARTVPHSYRKHAVIWLFATFTIYSLTSAGFGTTSMLTSYYGLELQAPYDSLADAEAITVSDIPANDLNAISAHQGAPINIVGYAIDIRSGLPASNIVARIDAHLSNSTSKQIDRADISTIFHDPQLRHAGFRMQIDTAHLSPGMHVLTLCIGAHQTCSLPFKRRIALKIVLPPAHGVSE